MDGGMDERTKQTNGSTFGWMAKWTNQINIWRNELMDGRDEWMDSHTNGWTNGRPQSKRSHDFLSFINIAKPPPCVANIDIPYTYFEAKIAFVLSIAPHKHYPIAYAS